MENRDSKAGRVKYIFKDEVLTLTVLHVDSLEGIGKLIDVTVFKGFTPDLTPEQATKKFGSATEWGKTINGERYGRWADESSFVDLVTRVNISTDTPVTYSHLRAGSETRAIDDFIRTY